MNRILILIGIINQLITTQANRALKNLDLPMAQFSLLLHFSHHPETGCTVTQLANAFEVNQPAMTKTTQRLLKKGLLKMQISIVDKRIKLFFITESGLSVLEKAWGKMEPEVKELSAEWSKGEMADFQEYLERFKTQLDEARD